MGIPDLRRIFRALDCHRVSYVLVGSLGAIAYGARLRTEDVDICNPTDPANLERIAAFLRELDARLLREPARGMARIDMADPASLRLDDPNAHHLFGTAYGDIDVLPYPLSAGGWGTSADYAQLNAGTTTVEAFGVQ